MITALCERLREVAPELGSEPTSAALVGIDRDPMAKVTLLLFGARGELVAVAKVARHPRADQALEAEHQALCGLANRPLAQLRDQVPTSVLLSKVCGKLTHVASAVAGGPMTRWYYTPGHVVDRRKVTRDFDAAGAWLAAFQQRTTSSARLDDGGYDRYVRPIVDRYRQRVGWSPWEANAFIELEHEIRTLGVLRTPITATHGDYAIGNILLRDGDVTGIVDWERGQPAGLPMLDVLKFATSYSSYLDRAQPPRRDVIRGHPGWTAALRRWPQSPTWRNFTGFMYGFFGDGWYPDLVRQFVRNHATRLGHTPETTSVMLRIFLAEQATALDNAAYRGGYRSLLRTVQEAHRARSPLLTDVR